jgi:pyruvate dehydrogenase E1 component alpha subunit
MKKNDLIEFEDRVCNLFNEGLIRAPIHLYSGNEDKMIEIFENIKEEDWCFCTWRSHYQCLLKGVDPEVLIKDILNGKSIALSYTSHNIYSSAIVTGIIPISVGVAMDIKMKKSKNHVWCFVGDMTSETGSFYENYKYSINMDLPITFVIENNFKSVCTDTLKTWGQKESTYSKQAYDKIIYYEYENKYPHAGSGKRIQF